MEFLLVVLFAFAGTTLGCVTGMIPGFHVNNIALIMLSISGSISIFLSSTGLIDELLVPVLVSIIIVATAIAHTFVNIIPSTFLGAPEEDTALVLLPAHSMLMEGRGYGAITLSATGSLYAVEISFLLLIPFRLLMGPPANLYWVLDRIMPFILLAVSAVLVGTEKSAKHVMYALLIFGLSGVFGMQVMDMGPSSPVGANSSLLFPALAGLFGIPTLIHSFGTASLPEQRMDEERIDFMDGMKDAGTGVVAGSVVSILPGVTSAVATIMAMVARGKKDRENVIVTLSSVNTAASFFVLSMLFIAGKARSGSAIAINEIMNVERWNAMLPPYSLCHMLIAVVISALVSYHATRFMGRVVARHISSTPYDTVAKVSVVFISFMVFVFTGFVGIAVLVTGTFIGMLCLELKVRRSLCMGILLLPIMLTYFL